MKGQDLKDAIENALKLGYRIFDSGVIHGKDFNNEKDLGEALREGLKKNNISRSDIILIAKIS
jgi:diketogulonate reductase-like aldo/keto reductase